MISGEILIGILVALIVLILAGLHIGLVLGIVSLVGMYLAWGDLGIAFELANQSTYGVLRNSVFAAIPLFVLMGEFMSKSGMAGDLYKLINHFLSRIPGRLAVATVFGNAAFAAVTGVSIASAMAFSRIAYPEMRKFNYNRSFALGAIAGSASLGMLIPPSILLIVWGIVIEYSIGKLFLAGLLPGLLLAALMAFYCMGRVAIQPSLAPSRETVEDHPPTVAEVVSGLGVVILIVLILGGLYAGFFTPSESGAVGCYGAIVFAYLKGLRWQGYREAVIGCGKTIAPIMFLLVTAAMYSKFLAIGGLAERIQGLINDLGLTDTAVTILMVLIWLALGMLLDSLSIILLTVPIFWPIAQSMGWDVNAFAIFGILAIEAGILTPPFGLIVYTVKGAVPDPSVTLSEIFAGSVPYWIIMLVVMVMIWIFPEIAIVLTR